MSELGERAIGIHGKVLEYIVGPPDTPSLSPALWPASPGQIPEFAAENRNAVCTNTYMYIKIHEADQRAGEQGYGGGKSHA